MPLACLTWLSLLVAQTTTGWSKPVVVRHGTQPVVRFQARLTGEYVLIRAVHVKGWHTYAIDNALRAEEALQGKKSLGIEQGLSLEAVSGLELDGPWLQTPPQDFSQPELRWFTYGFDETAIFACRVKPTGEPVCLRIRGQACSGETCNQFDIRLDLASKLPISPGDPQGDSPAELLKGLIPVRDEASVAGLTPQPAQSQLEQ